MLPARAPSAAIPSPPAEPRPASVLLVGTAPLLRRAMRALLEDAGFPVLEAADGRGGLLLLACGRPAVAVVDYALPDISGTELTRRLRGVRPPVEVIMHTRASAEAIADQARAAGARAILAQGSRPGMLLALVQAALDAHETRQGGT
jgi:two-component system KDP operon response regulator KdpE